MSEKIKLTISPAVAAYVRPGTTPETRLSGCASAMKMPVADQLMLLFCLSKDTDPEIRATAAVNLKELPAGVIAEYVSSADSHPVVIAALPTLCQNYSLAFPPIAVAVPQPENKADEATEQADHDDEADPGQEEEAGEGEIEEEEYLSKYKMAQIMGIAEKIKMALSGDKEWRSILVKDANKLVSGSVIKNPRITESEILALVKSGIQNDEIMRLICANKEWVKNYNIRKALVENNRTPVQNATRFLNTMSEKDLAYFAKSKNIATVISTMAKRLLLNKKK